MARAQQAESASQQRLRQVMQQARDGGAAAPVPAERLKLRADLLAEGEAALARVDTTAALSAFERAAVILHAADTEMGLVRTYMQSGEYRRALSFGAHTAGAHLDAIGGTALYAWLLHAGGQEGIARQLLAQARDRAPGQPLAAQVEEALRASPPRPLGAMLQPPARLAPYSRPLDLPAHARVVASATLVGNGAAALVPAAALSPGRRYWVRNGLGLVSAATAAPAARAHWLALLKLADPLPRYPVMRSAADAFPGSIAFAVEFAGQPDAAPAWPLLKSGFTGAALDNAGTRALGVEMAPGGLRGGPVFDANGLLTGIALSARPADLLVPVSRLQQAFGADLFAAAPARGARQGVDAVYEAALGPTLQLLRA
ncbi:hypothetical protein EEB15_02530 [Ramlibacter sp. WS9]|nr:hypothetical protein EEB15_02530 [Ramlibacter sp. WS9]